MPINFPDFSIFGKNFSSRNILKFILSFVTITLLIIIYENHRTTNYLTGLWQTSEDFNNSADISSGMLYIGESKGLIPKTHKAYLLINNDISNQLIEIKYKFFMPNSLWFTKSKKAGINLVFSENETMPDELTAYVDIEKGELMLLDDENTLWGLFYKNHEISARELTDDSFDDLADDF